MFIFLASLEAAPLFHKILPNLVTLSVYLHAAVENSVDPIRLGEDGRIANAEAETQSQSQN